MSEKITLHTEESFEGAVASGAFLVDFYADWCGPCRMLYPILEKVANEVQGRVTIIKIDIDRAQKIAALYSITSVPTLLLFKDGKEIGRIVGLRDEKAIVQFLDTSLKT